MVRTIININKKAINWFVSASVCVPCLRIVVARWASRDAICSLSFCNDTAKLSSLHCILLLCAMYLSLVNWSCAFTSVSFSLYPPRPNKANRFEMYVRCCLLLTCTWQIHTHTASLSFSSSAAHSFILSCILFFYASWCRNTLTLILFLFPFTFLSLTTTTFDH